MSKRKPTPKMKPPSPIEELLDPRPTPSDLPKNSTEERRSVEKTEKQKDRKTENRPQKIVQPTLADTKSKCTYYIPTTLAERIDMAHAQSRVFTRSSRYKASKSEFIEAAVSYALNEFDKNGQQSEIVVLLAELITKKGD